jgi:hypothetical protein
MGAPFAEGEGCDNSVRGPTRSALQGRPSLRTLRAAPRDRPAESHELVFPLRDVDGTLSDRRELFDGVAERLGPYGRCSGRDCSNADSFQTPRLQLVLGDDRAEVSLDNLERLENWPLC